MSKLTAYNFVEIFNENRNAGQAQYVMRGGQLPMKLLTVVRSTITGMYCADKELLLVERAVETDAHTPIDELPKGRIETIRDLSVTQAVRELNERADDWHGSVKDQVAAAFPEFNPQEEGETEIRYVPTPAAKAAAHGMPAATAATAGPHLKETPPEPKPARSRKGGK